MSIFKKIGHYFHNVLVGADQEGNVILGGEPGETISSHTQRMKDEDKGPAKAIGTIVSDGLDLIQKDHGHLAEQGDLARAETIEKLEENAPKKSS